MEAQQSQHICHGKQSSMIADLADALEFNLSEVTKLLDIWSSSPNKQGKCKQRILNAMHALNLPWETKLAYVAYARVCRICPYYYSTCTSHDGCSAMAT